MGYGSWTRESFIRYSAARGRSVDASGRLDDRLSETQIFTQRGLNPMLSPFRVMRECRDCEEHPLSIPVILALDVTGSMGKASTEVAKRMNVVMEELYKQIKGVEFMVMGIGDLMFDSVPIQISQFESDIRIAEQLDLVFMEHGGGPNAYESYTAAWYMGLYHTQLDAWKRGKKGLIITMGDEPMNPYLPAAKLAPVTGDELQGDIETRELYRQASEKFEIYHLHVTHNMIDRTQGVKETFGALLPYGHVRKVDLNGIAKELIRIIVEFAVDSRQTPAATGPSFKYDYQEIGGLGV